MTEEEFAALYVELREDIYSYLLFRVPHVDDTRDVLSETFLTVWDKRTEMVSHEWTPRAYVFGVAKICALRHQQQRQRKHHDNRFAVDFGGEPVRAEEDVADGVARSDGARWIASQLTPAEVDLMTLLHTHSLDRHEIATLLGITVNAYDVRVHRFRRRIEDLSAQYEQADRAGREA